MLYPEYGGHGSSQVPYGNMQALIAQLAQPGWPGLDAIPDLQDENARKQGEPTERDVRDAAYLECFTSEAGRLVLQDLIENVILMPSAGWTPGQTAEQHAAFAIASDAQKGLVWAFIKRMDEARKRKADGKEPDNAKSD